MGHQEYRCRICGSRWARHFVTCGICGENGFVLPWADRPHAAIDSMPVLTTARKLVGKSCEMVEHSTYRTIEIGVRAVAGVYGDAYQGKSTLSCRLVDGIPGPALLVSAEEGASPSLSERLRRANVKRGDFYVLPRANVEQVVSYAKRLKARSLLIDSLQVATWTSRDLRHVIDLVGSLVVVVAVLQVNKRGLPAGENAIIHELDVNIHVDAMRWTLKKSRYQLPGISGDVLPKESDDSETQDVPTALR